MPMIIGEDSPNPFTANSIFNVSAMSYGAISRPAVEALSKGAGMAGCWMDTGEGGLSPYHLVGNCDIIAEIGTAKYGYRNLDGTYNEDKIRQVAALEQVKAFEIKLSQGAKPGKGGLLPAIKVTPEIAEIRGIHPYQDSVSPNRHPEIKNDDDLLDTINWLRDLTQKPVGIKFVVGELDAFRQLCETIQRRGKDSAPDFMTIDSADGGTGAAPQPLMDYVGMLLSESLPGVIDTLREYDLRPTCKSDCIR